MDNCEFCGGFAPLHAEHCPNYVTYDPVGLDDVLDDEGIEEHDYYQDEANHRAGIAPDR